MKSNSAKFRIRQLIYCCNEFINDYVYPTIYYDLDEVNLIISKLKRMDLTDPINTYIYIIEVI